MFALFGLVFVLSACAGDVTADGPADDDSSPAPAEVGPEGDWVLASGTVDGNALPMVEGYDISMSLDGQEISGTAACNGYGGSYSLVDGTFSLSDIFSTMMACLPDVMDSETAFHAALGRVDEVAPTENELVLAGEGVELRFVRAAVIPTAELLGTEWILQSLIMGDAVSSTVGEPATLLLGADGTFTASTGCRTVSGDYLITGETVSVRSMSADGECGEEVASQDGFVIAVLEGPFTVTIVEDRLTITAPGGDGLDYRS